MPLVRLDMVRGRSPDQVRAIADAVQEALVEALGIPARDRFQIVTQHEPKRSSLRMPGWASTGLPGS